MKTTSSVSVSTPVLDLKSLPMSVRKLIKEKRENAEALFLDDLKQLFTRDSISQDDFMGVFDAHREFIFLGISAKEIQFKKDGTPDLRSLPVLIRKFFKSVREEAEQIKKAAMDAVLSKETITNHDLLMIQEIYRVDPYKGKFRKTAA